ncbi:Ca2+/calmodulin-dependent protein kinase [Scheffersomyces amazonensis]|uniref:Ca2+/calmodulin-dependent protein kinase n=1 Tax=Scheffersomyces amazonensis TaxID=1078765 RepID=UPI00315CCFCF
MNIPLKAKPKVSTINILDDSKFQLDHDNSYNDNSIQEFRPSQPSQPNQDTFGSHLLKIRQKNDQNISNNNLNISGTSPPKELTNYRLLRRYSETEKNNFDETTGHRLYNDGKIRPQRNESSYNTTTTNNNDGTGSSSNVDINRFNRFTSFNSIKENSITPSSRSRAQSPNKIYSRSHDELLENPDTDYLVGLEDEYIPGLDFADLIYQWNKNISDQNLADANPYGIKKMNSHSTTNSHTSTPQSREASYLDLNQLHAKVAPQPIRTNVGNPNKYSFTKLHDFMKSRGKTNETIDESVTTLNEGNISRKQGEDIDVNHKNKRQKSDTVSTGTDVNYEWILNSLPQNFNDLPYSQRKKMVRSFSESIDYSQFSLFAKNYLNDKLGSSTSSGKTNKSGGGNSGNNSYVRKSRLGSVSTVAERLLARTSTTDLKSYDNKPMPPRINVDERGAIVMDHELGKIIGFGAWGTIRECTDRHGTVRAIKIVKSTRDFDSSSGRTSSPSRSELRNSRNHNPKVLEVFKKEISIWKQLHHENILPLLKHLETEHAIFCITNRIYGGTLFELVSSWGQFNAGIMTTTGPLEFSINGQRTRLKKVIYCTAQIVKALLYMHEMKGIVHGDLKLENVLVENENRKDKNSQDWNDDSKFKMILCDFGMSRVYTSRLSRKSSARYLPNPMSPLMTDDETLMMRSKSSNTEIRKPYQGGDSINSRKLDLIQDDSKLGISHFIKPHGPSLQSLHLTPTESSLNSYFEAKLATKKAAEGIDSDLPHSHIGSLPYASPELLSPAPPPLGPSADVWALGVLMYTMCVGKLPFQHQYEPRLRAMITAGKYIKEDLKKACLLEWIFKEKDDSKDIKDGIRDALPASLMIQSPSLIDLKRQEELQLLQKEWLEYKDKREFQWLYEIVTGCLEKDITKRWDMEMIYESFCRNSGEIERSFTA